MITQRFASIFSLGAPKGLAGANDEFSNQLGAPTLDDRAAFYLRAVHEKDDFTNEQYTGARSLILDAMAAEIAAKSPKLDLPVELGSLHPFENGLAESFGYQLGLTPYAGRSSVPDDFLAAPEANALEP